MLRSLDRVVSASANNAIISQGYGGLPPQALSKLETRVVTFLKATHHREVLITEPKPSLSKNYE